MPVEAGIVAGGGSDADSLSIVTMQKSSWEPRRPPSIAGITCHSHRSI